MTLRERAESKPSDVAFEFTKSSARYSATYVNTPATAPLLPHVQVAHLLEPSLLSIGRNRLRDSEAGMARRHCCVSQQRSGQLPHPRPPIRANVEKAKGGRGEPWAEPYQTAGAHLFRLSGGGVGERGPGMGAPSLREDPTPAYPCRSGRPRAHPGGGKGTRPTPQPLRRYLSCRCGPANERICPITQDSLSRPRA
ncbi:hypothetical protein C8Q80DRAFT_387655 [Daedaleopsis nitida]|nr:hypothetical protein C8Q80DRAFT_387655 [Daedaleopsis nitida]